ncbi:DUF2752 domain-containing protein [Candidatus Sumerlaeota bacterium]|nr:DUF2752 domain-containing protein [Candidatus Sumerlaeota bacterium]
MELILDKGNISGETMTLNQKRVITGIVLGGMVMGGIFLYLVPPGKESVYPPCTFHSLTGLYCAGCGSTRALHHLLHGRIIKAISNNILTVFLLIPLAWFGVHHLRYMITGVRRHAPDLKMKYAWILIGLIILYTILRNLPYYPFTLLAPLE